MHKKLSRAKKPLPTRPGHPLLIGDRIRTARDKHGDTQTGFADEIKSSSSLVAKWEAGDFKRGPYAGSLVEISLRTGASVDWLLGLIPGRDYVAVGVSATDVQIETALAKRIRVELAAKAREEAFKAVGPVQPSREPDEWHIDGAAMLQNAIAHETELVTNWLRWYNQSMELSRIAAVIRTELTRIAPQFKRATFTSPSTEAFDTIRDALQHLIRVANSIAEPPRPAAIPDRVGPDFARRVGSTPVEVMRGLAEWVEVVEGKAKLPDEPNLPPPTIEEVTAQIRALIASAARTSTAEGDRKAQPK
jgi:transcriptional regulator with XRE-family HTH domain